MLLAAGHLLQLPTVQVQSRWWNGGAFRTGNTNQVLDQTPCSIQTHRVEKRVLLLDAEPRVLVLGLHHHLVALLAMVGRSRLLVVLYEYDKCKDSRYIQI